MKSKNAPQPGAIAQFYQWKKQEQELLNKKIAEKQDALIEKLIDKLPTGFFESDLFERAQIVDILEALLENTSYTIESKSLLLEQDIPPENIETESMFHQMFLDELKMIDQEFNTTIQKAWQGIITIKTEWADESFIVHFAADEEEG